ncbi:hypothetical protein AVEN_124791-1 [Araneus ventricosus]|uniref:Uncharacterized protein n=1 Tax=Araneus ventricosus TaxID=182803 RepID=A0A4Y2TIK1_ARAVE|nr:hypothetical protein AVEN_124791-1 [Araneus ventricosus]
MVLAVRTHRHTNAQTWLMWKYKECHHHTHAGRYVSQQSQSDIVAHIIQELEIFVGRSIVRHRLDYRKLCSRWKSLSLSSAHKGENFAASLHFVQCCAVEGNDFLRRIITDNEAWLHHSTTETERASMAWKYSSLP